MGTNGFEARMRQMRSQMKGWWGRLTDDDLNRAAGRPDQIIDALKWRYNCTYEEAEREFYQRVQESVLESK
jgi:uncharacterized protein YjbJ (UPF0337 family)